MEDGEAAACWRVVHISGKPPVSPTQQPTVEVLASVVEPKLANSLIRRFNQITPLENLRHVKRIKKDKLERGSAQLSVILCLASESSDPMSSFMPELQQLVDSNQLSPFVAKVCKYAATSKEEWDEQCKLWPTSYHPSTYNIDGITGFGEEDARLICSYMKLAMDMAKSGDSLVVNAAIIVDPSSRHIVARGCDVTCSWQTSSMTTSINECCLKEPSAVLASPHSSGAASRPIAIAVDKAEDPRRFYVGGACSNPWLWSKFPLISENPGLWHPLRHAALVAIESSAERDKCLFPDSEHVGHKPLDLEPERLTCPDSPAKRRKTNLGNVDNEKEEDVHAKDCHFLPTRPYLCTGYDIYLVWEPCVMCAMALVHQRIRRLFFAFPNPNAGALGSVHRLQGEKSLNHHYAVFRVTVPEDVLGVI